MLASGVDESAAQFLTTREGRVAWNEAGPAQAAALPLVLIHGFTGHRDDFIGVLEPLARIAGGRRVLAPDLRGHGDSEKQPGACGWSFEQLLRDLTAFLDALGLDRVDLLGHSMGGFVALRCALYEPARVRSLALLCTGPEVPTTLDRQGFVKAAEIAQARGMQGLQALVEKVGRLDPSPTLAGWSERYWAHQRRRFAAMTPASYRGLGLALFDSMSLVARLGKIETPALVMVGEHDSDWLPGAELFAEYLPNVQRRVLARAEHHPHNENPTDFLAEMERHLRDLEPSFHPNRIEGNPA